MAVYVIGNRTSKNVRENQHRGKLAITEMTTPERPIPLVPRLASPVVKEIPEIFRALACLPEVRVEVEDVFWIQPCAFIRELINLLVESNFRRPLIKPAVIKLMSINYNAMKMGVLKRRVSKKCGYQALICG